MERKKSNAIGATAPALPILAGVFWGSCPVFVRFLYEGGLDNSTILFARMSLAAVFLFAWILIADKEQLRVKPKDIWILLLGSIAGCYGLNWFYNEAIARVNVSLAAVLLSLFTIFSVFLSRLFFKEQITPRKIVCVCIAILGVLLVSGVLEGDAVESISLLGVGAGVMSAVCYAISGLCIRFASGRGYSTFTINFYYALFITIVVAAFADWSDIASYVCASPIEHGGFLILHALCTMLLPYVLFAASLKHIELGKASILSTDESAAAMLFGWLVFGEVPTPLMVVGLIVVIAALAIMNMPSLKERKRARLAEGENHE